MTTKGRHWYTALYVQVLIAVVLGALVGWLFPTVATALSHCRAKATRGLHLRILKPPRRPRATWSLPRRVARGVFELT
jgi:hypothetical protein